MKRIFGLITICSILAMPVLAAKPVVSNPIEHPLSATDVHLVKKVPLPPVVGEEKGKPASPPGQDKDRNGGSSEGATTGILGTSATGNKYAVVVGICNYPGTNHDICWSDGDSLNMYKALKNYSYTDENIYLLRDMVGLNNEPYYEPEGIITDGPATAEKIEWAISQIEGKIQDGEEVVFFFSGHGADGIAVDGDSERRDEGIVAHDGTNIFIIWDGQLKERFSQVIATKTSRIAFVFDSCLAGGMNDVADTGRVVSMATGGTQVAYVFSKGEVGVEPGEGVFSHYFVNEGMVLGLADRYFENGNHNGQVVVEEAFDYANGIIPDIYKRQNPTISDNFTNDLLLGY
jgi:hypothetical protein